MTVLDSLLAQNGTLLPLSNHDLIHFFHNPYFMNIKRESIYNEFFFFSVDLAIRELLFHRRLHILDTSKEAGSLIENSVVNMVLLLLKFLRLR